MPQSLDRARLREFYERHLEEVLLPFWLKHSVDRECGGYFTCFENAGANLLSHDKYTWGQGRMVWVLAKLAGMRHFPEERRAEFLALARAGALFLMEHCLLPNGHCTFLMDRGGAPKPAGPGQLLDASIYADCFVLLGLARYAATSGDRAALTFARTLYGSIRRRVDSGTFSSAPYPVPAGYKAHGIPMILLNTAQEVAGALHTLAEPGAAEVTAEADACMHEILDHFVAEDGTLHEMIDTHNALVPDTLLGRYVNPGHTLEDMWFVLHQLRSKGDPAAVARVARVIQRACTAGWDQEYGGLLLFADQDGGAPRGHSDGMDDEPMVRKVREDWGNKLWWPHSEALYTTLLAFEMTGDCAFLDLYQKVHDYTFRTFPNPNGEIGEWIQIRDRQGRPEQKVVGLPVKDPFHIIRNAALIIGLLAGAADQAAPAPRVMERR